MRERCAYSIKSALEFLSIPICATGRHAGSEGAMKLKIGTWVGFTPKSGNPDTGKKYCISSIETHQGLTFYRLEQVEGGLFLRESLYP